MLKKVLSYTTAFKALHWLIAFIVILMLCFSFFLGSLPEANQSMAYMIHKSFGLTILGLMLVRVAWIFFCGQLKMPSSVPYWELFGARFLQYSFYATLIIMPLFGWILSMANNHTPSYFGIFLLPFPGITPNKSLSNWMDLGHTTLAWILIALIILHVAGVLKFHFINQYKILRRMWF